MDLDSAHAETGGKRCVHAISSALCRYSEDDYVPGEGGDRGAPIQNAGEGNTTKRSLGAVVVNPHESATRSHGGNAPTANPQFLRIFDGRALRTQCGAKRLKTEGPVSVVRISFRQQQRPRKAVAIGFEVDVSKSECITLKCWKRSQPLWRFFPFGGFECHRHHISSKSAEGNSQLRVIRFPCLFRQQHIHCQT